MNRNLKFAIAAAIASLGVTGQAHALTASSGTSTTYNSGSLFLYAFEDRQANPAATNSAIFDLGLASGFDATKNQTFDFSANSDWTTYIATVANPANIHWGVFGAMGTGGKGSSLFSTFSNVPAPLGGSAFQAAVTNSNAEIGVYGATGGSGTATSNDLASGKWDDTAGVTASYKMTAGLGQSMDFFKYTSTGGLLRNNATQTAFATTFNLSNTGVLTVTAVPEADSYAMMLAGLGLVGYMVRRRKAA